MPGSTTTTITTATPTASSTANPTASRAPVDESALALARAAAHRVQIDPPAAERELTALLDSRAGGHAEAIAHWGLARLRHDAGAHEAAVQHFERAIALAADAGDADDLATIRVSAAVTFQTIGHLDRALGELDLAAPAVRDAAAGRWAGQRALVLLHLGRPAEAIHGFDRALADLAGSDDRAAVARTLLNRAVAHLQRGSFAAARADLLAARDVAEAAGEHLVTAGALHNLGHLDGRLGRVPSALAAFEQARATYLRFGGPGRLLAALDADHGEVLLAVGLAPEALEVADALVRELARSGDVLSLGPARLMRARALTILGRSAEAASEARAAADLLGANGREAWAALAAYVGVVAAGDAVSGAGELDALAARLDAAGWRAEAAEVRIVDGRLAIERGDLESARAQLARASRPGSRSSVDVRAQAALAVALLRLADGRPAAAQLAARRGLALVEAQRASVGSRELRAVLSAVGVPLVEVGTRIALASGRAAAVLRWAEHGRAVAMAAPLPSPPEDPELAAALAELRELDASRADTPGADARIAQLERRILHRRRLEPGAERLADRPATAAELRRALGDRTLVEFVAAGGSLHAVVVDRRRTSLVPLGAVSDAEAAVGHLLFSLRRLTLLADGDARGRAARRAVEHDAADLDALLLAALRLGSPTRGLVVVPTGALHDVPWSALPSIHGRALTIAPSATAWLGRSRAATPVLRRPGGARRVVVVAGPDLAHAPTEAQRVAAEHRVSEVLGVADATAAAVLARAEGADVLHVAAHGRVRADRPMFSSLRLVDGPLGVHDLERLGRPPRTVVLTACEAGRSVVVAGDELLGTAAALLSLGVRTVVAPMVPVGDRATVEFAVGLHRRLATGADPAIALGAVLAEALAGDDPGAVAAAMSFQCIGVDAGAW